MYTLRITQKLSTFSAVALGLLTAFFFAVGMISTAIAHESPGGCFANGVGLSIAVFRSDGITPVGGGTVTPGETINYEATLSHLGGSNCDFGDGAGALAITLPDTSIVDVTGGGIPLVSAGSPFIAAQAPYVVDSADVNAGSLDAAADYTGGTSHTPTSHSGAQANVDISTPFEKLDPRVSTEVHDDAHTDVTNSVVTAGTEIHDFALVQGDGPIPTGDVDFILFSGLVCNGDLLDTENGVPVDGGGEAESTPFTPGPGEYSYHAFYSGDDDYNEAEAALCEPFTVAEALIVEKTVDESFDREWEWSIDKTADNTDIGPLQEGQPFLVTYWVDVDAVSTDINHEVTGEITVTNPGGNPDAEVTDVSDVLDVSGAATVSCEDEDADTTAPWTLSGGEVLTCTYEKLDASPNDTENEVTVTTSGDVPGGSDTEPVNFDESDLDEETDECIDVSDTNVGFLGTVCADQAPASFHYILEFGTDPESDVVLECGVNEHRNVADFVTNDTQSVGDDDLLVIAEVECVIGCTLTQGYWKTHSAEGPAPYDEEGWGNLGDFDGDGPEEEEDESWQPWNITWFDAFWTPPKGGNIWYKLAHQFQAAYLNVANGAGAPSEVSDALTDAEDWLKNNDPADKIKGKDAQDANGWHSTLASYNEGDIGPGHCDEDESSEVD